MGVSFPKSFVWGAASSAYQVEGAAATDGRGPSVWDEMCRRTGAIHGGHTGAVACDHYHRTLDDIQLMERMGLQAYRFSVSWSRVLPEGVGPLNPKGLEFYDRLVDALLAAGIEPWVTLFHWDFPLELFRRGGWLSRDSASWFAEYAATVAQKLGDRVGRWMTINEPQIFIGLGHGDGTHAPGLKLSLAERLLATHHVLLAHGRGVQAIRSNVRRRCEVGWAPVMRVEYPATASAADMEAARRSTFSITSKDSWNNTWFADPVCLGEYPAEGVALFGADAPEVRPGDLETINQPLDFFGANIYSGTPVKAGPGGNAVALVPPPGAPETVFRWSVSPESLYWGPRFLHERYGLPVVITENGMSSTDWVGIDGRVRDGARIDFTRRYLSALRRAVQDGVDIRGYFHWSILDNFEWAEGYRHRFGLVHVDYETQQRTLKDSAYWYGRVIATQGRALDEPVDTVLAALNQNDRPVSGPVLSPVVAVKRG
ncbi:MAG: GH1 family beta-glucosidase [Phycisphaerales bacterium]